MTLPGACSRLPPYTCNPYHRSPMGNATLNHAKDAKQDDFWTQLPDIEKECSHYREHFRGKTILCNCDDPLVSNFVRYFALNFHAFGLKRLISTCYKNPEGDLFSPGIEEKGCFFDFDGSDTFNSVEELVAKKKKTLPEGCWGDFRQAPCVDLLKQADIVVTNPPFSLFRDFVAQLVKYNKQFLIVGNINAVKYKEIFPLIQQNKIWLGYTGGSMVFQVPPTYGERKTRFWVDDQGRHWRSLGNSLWFTNLDTQKRHEKIPLWETYSDERFPRYVNFDAIEVPKVATIPKDYPGMIGVPITFLDKYCPDQFEIVGVSADVAKPMQVIKDWYAARPEQGHLRTGGDALYYWKDQDVLVRTYDRIVIRNKHPEIAQ